MITPKEFRKILILAKDIRGSSGESLGEYFVRLNSYLSHNEVEIYELSGVELERVHLDKDNHWENTCLNGWGCENINTLSLQKST